MFQEELDFFQNQSLQLSLDPNLAKLNAPPPENGVFISQQLKLPSATSFNVLGQSLSAEFDQQLQVAVIQNSSLNQVFDDSTGGAPEALPSLWQLSFQIGAGLGGDAEIPVGTLVTAAVNAKADGSFKYRLVRTPAGETRLDALKFLAAQTRFPLRLELKDLAAAGAVQQFQFQYELDFGIKLSLGVNYSKQFDALGKLFEGTALKFDAQAALKASLGCSLYEKMDCTIGCLAGSKVAPPWVRVRLDRTRKRTFTAGLSFSLQVQYNLGSVLIQLLEDVLELAPVKKFRNALTRLADDMQPVAAGDWQAVVDKLGQEVADELDARLDLKSYLSQGKFDEIWKTAQSITTAYNNLDTRLQDFWQRLLFKADLSPGSKIRDTLQKIADLKGKTFAETVRTLVDPDFSEQIEMVEALAGESLEQLLTGLGSRPQDAIQKAATLAAQSQTFLNTFPNQVISRWNQMAQESGLAKAMNFIQTNLTSPQQLSAKLDDEMEKLITRLLGKALDKVSQEDLARIQTFAKKVTDLIEKVTDFDQDWKSSLAKLNGDLGFNLGAEIGYEAMRQTLFDLELDSTNSALQDNWSLFQKLDIPGFLAKLPQTDDNEEPPFRINECLFTSSRLRTSTFSLLLNRLGEIFDATKETTKRFQQSRVEVKDAPALYRTASFTGSLYKEVTRNKFKWTSTIALEVNGKGDGSDLSDSYTLEGFNWVVTTHISNPNVNQEQLEALRTLLTEFLFPTNPADFVVPTGENTAFAFNLRLTLDNSAVDAFLKLAAKQSVAAWQPYLLSAARAFYGSALVPSKKIRHKPAYEVLPAAVLSPSYLQYLPMEEDPPLRTFIEVALSDGKNLRFDMRVPDGTLVDLGLKAGNAGKVFGRLAAGTEAVETQMDTASCRKLTLRYPRLANRCSPDGWSNPMFAALLVWSVIKDNPEFTPGVNSRGLGSLRFQQGATWTNPVWFALGDVQPGSSN
ncbi:hypothetical protein [Acanthopleuribacter pedis]|uniref:Uncharacterized protein n=1 Tax=Acanthopleuribacter pedis TaxID=442870 RepID=A0A8J7Q7Q2_9BACT|nr:hypothetical protein [Acanthopleuribacter pedis]MBO1319227.1 hypothetical protein [Acanthopleuribacter pedis]